MDAALVEFERSLDERAKAALRELTEDVAVNLLRDCHSRSVRNPSAYVFVAARKARPSQLNDTIERLQGDLDDKAIAQLRELPADQSMRILDELAQNWDQVRNPSAYVSTAVKNFHTNHPPGSKLPALGGAAAPMMLGAPMEHSVTGVMAVPLGYPMMSTMSPQPMAGAPPMAGSAPDPLACAVAGQALGAPMAAPLMGHPMAPQMPPPGMTLTAGAPLAAPMGAAPGATMATPMGPMATMLPTMGAPMGAMAPMGTAVPMVALGRPGAAVQGFPGCGGFGNFGAFCGQPPPPTQPPPPGIVSSFAGLTQKQIEQELESSIARLGLDEIANEALHRVPLETAREILAALDGGVRNPSAFVMSKIRSFQDGPGGGGSSGPSSRPPSGGLVGGGALPALPAERLPESKEEMRRRNDEALERFGADDRAKNIAREIPPEALFDIFSQLRTRDIRNPSAFIFQACVNYQKQHPQPTGYPSYPPQQPFATKPGATAEQVEEAVQRLELDTAASADMRALPPESAMGILEQITEGVKNKSAFATTAARRMTGRLRSRSRSRSRSRRRSGAGAGGEAAPRGRSRSRGRGRSRERSRSRDGGRHAERPRPLSRAEAAEVVDRMIKRCDLDDRAAQAMRALHADDAIRIMEDLQRSSEVRNASAFAYTAAKKLMGSFNTEDAQRKLDLDETAVNCLNAILPSEAREILESVDDGLRNPSAFVTAQVRRLHPELPALSGARGGGDAGGAAAAVGRGASSLRSSFPPDMPMKELEKEVEDIMRSMNLDERASGVLHEVPLEKAMDILGELRRNWTNVRKPSAYVFNACVKEINSTSRGAPLSGLDAGAAGAAGAAFPPPPPGMPPGAPLGMAGVPGALPGMPGPPPGMPGGPPLGMGIPGPPPGLPGLPQVMPGPPPLGAPGMLQGIMPGPPPGVPPGVPASGLPAAAPALPSTSGPRADPAERKAEVQRAIEKWNLDESALGALLQIPAEQALEILKSLDAGVRNPSAFVTTAARKRLDAGATGQPQAGGSFGMVSEDAADFRRTLKEQVDGLIRKSDLDEKATNLLQELPLEGALEILGELQRKRDQVRNPSAYVFNAGVKFQEKLAHGRQPPAGQGALTLAQRVDQLIEHFRLDAYALSALRSVSLEASLGILDQMRDGLAGDPSEHVRRAVDRMQQQTRDMQMPPMLDPFGNEQAIAQRAESMAREMGVDENSLAALQTVPLESAMHFLNRLADSRSSIRNPSAFIISSVKDYRVQHQGGPGGTPVPVAQGVGAETDRVMVGRQLDAAISRLNLDRTAVEALRALPEEDAWGLVSSIDGSVRNPSAWVTNAARNALQRGGEGRAGEGRAGDGDRQHPLAIEGERQHGPADASPPRLSRAPASPPRLPRAPEASLPPLPPPPAPLPPLPSALPPPPAAASPPRDARPTGDGLPPAPPPPAPVARDAAPALPPPAPAARAPRLPPPPPPPASSSSASPPPAAGSGPRRERSPEDLARSRDWRKWDIHKWLDHVDRGTGALREYSTVLARNLESPEQLVEIYCRKAEDGRQELEDSFFRDVGVEDAGHQRLFHRWMDRHLNS